MSFSLLSLGNKLFGKPKPLLTEETITADHFRELDKLGSWSAKSKYKGSLCAEGTPLAKALSAYELNQGNAIPHLVWASTNDSETASIVGILLKVGFPVEGTNTSISPLNKAIENNLPRTAIHLIEAGSKHPRAEADTLKKMQESLANIAESHAQRDKLRASFGTYLNGMGHDFMAKMNTKCAADLDHLADWEKVGTQLLKQSKAADPAYRSTKHNELYECAKGLQQLGLFSLISTLDPMVSPVTGVRRMGLVAKCA